MRTFAFEGRFPVSWLIVAGLLIAGLFLFLTIKERRYATRPKWMWALLGLRLIVVALVLWALAGPTDVIDDKRTKPKGFGVFVDGSASMTIEDIGDGSGNVARWADAPLSGSEETPVRWNLDKALGAMSGARAGLRQFVSIPIGSDDSIVEEIGERVLDKARGALDACNGYLDEIGSGFGEFEERESTDFAELRLLVNEKIVPEMARLSVTQAGKGSSSIATIEGMFDKADRTLRLLADALYSRHEELMSTELAADSEAVMERDDRISQVTPWVEALEREWIDPQTETLRVGRFAFASEAIPTSADAWRKYLIEKPADPESGTNLGSAIEQAGREAAAGRLHAGVIVTDGAHNVGRDPREAAAALAGLPFAIVPIGDSRLRRDLFLHHVQYPKSLIHKDVLSIDAKITAHDCEGEKVRVELVSGETVIKHKTVTIRTEMEDHRVNLRWKPAQIGVHELQLRVVPVDDEFTEENNSEALKVQVVDDEMRVFIADDLPRWEFRYLLSLFKRDPKVKLESALFSPQHIYPNRRNRPPVPRLPGSIEEWRRFRVVILGDLTQQQFSAEQQKQVKQYLVEGGNLVVIAGENAMPQKYDGTAFGDLLPVDFAALSRRASVQGFTLAVTPGGRDVPPVQLASTAGASAALWDTISKSLPVYDLSPCSIPKPTANVLIEAKPVRRSSAERRAFLSWQYVGRGRIVYASAPALHKLRYRHGDRYHYRFWGQMLRWIVARPDRRIEVGKADDR